MVSVSTIVLFFGSQPAGRFLRQNTYWLLAITWHKIRNEREIENLKSNLRLVVKPVPAPISNNQKTKGPMPLSFMLNPLKLCKTGHSTKPENKSQFKNKNQGLLLKTSHCNHGFFQWSWVRFISTKFHRRRKDENSYQRI